MHSQKNILHEYSSYLTYDVLEIGRRIAGYRTEKGMTQMGLANELGVSIDEILGNDKKVTLLKMQLEKRETLQ